MSNNCKLKNRALGAAANCKKILKDLKIRKYLVSVGALCVALTGAVIISADRSDEAALTASLVNENVSVSYALRSPIPPKKYDVKIDVDGKTLGVKCAGTVADALKAADVDVFDDDLINIGFNEPLNNETRIVINRVDIVEEVKVKTIDYATKYREDDGFMVGYTETVVDGEEGEVETTLRHVYIDGELVSSDVIDEDITAPVDEVIVVGTCEPKSTIQPPDDLALDADGVPLEYSGTVTGKATAYTAKPGALTASGREARVGHVAVDPDLIPYGTELYIASNDGSKDYGYAIAADTGGAMLSGRVLVDLYMDTYDECCQWGLRDVTIYILG
ncbi:MAG: G5 domain-containing protein [Oscillospiraceae bacterium]|nr:G5 domain-containing protein [Oscillospiraceae bacterium]